MNTCIYRGWVRHRRFNPRGHQFRYRLAMLYLDLAELDTVFRGRWLWSAQRPALARFRREDHFGDPSIPLDTSVRDLVEREIGRRPQGPIRLLTNLRYFGYCFNPISIYYCFGATNEEVEYVVAEVTNTPWGERHCYVIDGISHRRFQKRLHVSPFLPMSLNYLWRGTRPDRRLAVHMDVFDDRDKRFDATLVLQRQALDGPALAGALLRFMTFKVIAAIHWEALRLWLKGVPVYNHPDPTEVLHEGIPPSVHR